MSKRSTPKTKNDIPVLKREQLGKGVRGKYFRQYWQGSNVVVLRSEIHQAFPTSEVVNQALTHFLAATRETARLTRRSTGHGKQRRAG